MTYRGHLTAGGGATYALVYAALPAPAPFSVRATLLFTVLLASLLPDADHPQSYLGRRLFGLPYVVKFAISNPLTWLVAGHRDRGRTRARRWIERLAYAGRHTDMRGWHPLARALAWAGAGVLRLVGWPLLVLHYAWRHLANGRQRLSIVVRHRGYSHSLLSLALLTALAGVAFWALYAALTDRLAGPAINGLLAIEVWAPSVWLAWHTGAFALGVLSHLVLDACTVEGVPLFLPATKRRVHMLPPGLRFTST